jgi:hypothetical protein
MKKRCLFLLVLILLGGSIWAQTKIALTPLTLSPSSYTLTTVSAGTTPANPVVSYTAQSVKYTWPFLGDGIVGYIDIQSSSVPSGMSYTVQAANPGGWGGSTSGLVLVDSYYKSIITGVWWASNKTVQLTQNVFVSNFAALRPGTYVVTLNYRLQ